MINTRDRDEILVSTVIKLIKRKAIPNLKNVIAKTHSEQRFREANNIGSYSYRNQPNAESGQLASFALSFYTSFHVMRLLDELFSTWQKIR